MAGVATLRAGYIFSAASAEGTANTALDLRASNGHFLRWFSASGGASANASAIYSLLHSHDNSIWTVMETVTASAGGNAVLPQTAQFSGGVYGYVKARLDKVYSAAQTGTGTLWLYVQGGVV